MLFYKGKEEISPVAVAGPLLTLLAALIPRDAEGLHALFLVCTILLLSAVLFAADCTGSHVPLLSQAARLVLDRTKNARVNWETNTFRSFAETISWLCISVQLYSYYGDAWVSAPLGALVGFGVVVVGDLLTSLACKLSSKCGATQLGELYLREVAVFIVLLAAGVGVRTSAPMMGLGLVLEPILASVCIVVLSQVLLRCSHGQPAGLIIHDRIVNTVRNWKVHTVRSSLEMSAWLAITYAVHSRASGLLPLSVGLSALAAFALSIIGELGFSYIDDSPAKPLNQDPKVTWREDEGVSKLVPVYTPEIAERNGQPLQKFTLAQVAEHNTKDDCWIVVDERAYDITRFVSKHPGGVGPVLNMAGKDATDVFANYHAARVYKTMLPAFLVGEVTDVKVEPHVADFRAARQEMLRQGLFKTGYRFYAKLSIWMASLFVSAVALSLGFVGGGGGYARMFGAGIMGVFWQQLAGVGHDLGHSGVSHDFHTDHIIGSLLSCLMGLSLSWWKSDHNTHHVVCNAIEHDPNIQHMPMLCITPKIFSKPFWDTYHKKIVGMDWVARKMISNQHIYFYPLMAVGRWNLYVQGLIYLITMPDTAHYRKTELCGLTIYFSWLFALALSMPTWALAIGWIFVSHGVAGILHVQIVCSHWSMDSYKGTPYTSRETEWYLMQLRTTMNIATPEWLDWMHIGLQFQIEHHLFPRLPRHNLRKARLLVKAIAAKHGIDYHEPGFFAGNLEMWRALKVTALAARKATKGDGGFYESKLWEGLNLSG
jgi:delta8-fatty-acid desaturase